MAQLDSQSKTLQIVYGWFAEDRLFVNRRYQRKLVWTLSEKQKLVSSVLKGYPIPAILLAEREGRYEIIDGLQRLYTLNSFIETSFPTEDNKYFHVDEFSNARNRRDQGVFHPLPEMSLELEPDEVVKFLDYPLSISVIRGASESEIDEVFSRINTYGHRLSDQERRQAGVQGGFPELVRSLASDIRGDSSPDILTLSCMPQISIDLPRMQHGYSIQADQVFWVKQGVLNASDLRDGLDEQCIADIVASIVGGQILERSKDALDRIYRSSNLEYQRIARGLDAYGSNRIADEFKYCIGEIEKITQTSKPDKNLKKILGITNQFPGLFSLIILALHDIVFSSKRIISDYDGVRSVFSSIYRNLKNTHRTSSSERKKVIDMLKGAISDYFISGSPGEIHSNASVIDIDNIIRRSEIELPFYELKQGVYDLNRHKRKLNSEVYTRVIETICAIANSKPEKDGFVLVGVADRDEHAHKIEELDTVSPRKVGKRYVVGVSREAVLQGGTVESYVNGWKTAIRESGLSEPLKSSVLTAIDYNDYYGLGVLIINVPGQKDPSYLNDKMYTRDVDETKEIKDPQRIAAVCRRFYNG